MSNPNSENDAIRDVVESMKHAHPHGHPMQVQALTPLCECPKCGSRAIVALTPAQRLAQPDETTHVCHPALGGCNRGFTDDRTRVEPSASHSGYAQIDEALTGPKRVKVVL